ncbi:glycosyltransferase [Cellulophaga baltica]|uniref:glycosyltransferase n=1 Tax=Cellulophaga TaxID=104264 RepID=UPI001C0671CF|nr:MULTISPECIES: glycosyltransferase [Cellulophaga]MBU2996738.1 glycosyltransferase [Cellulophaga baltica]MDO6768134.1 glycosyltransferase [Cellulophaga sp. 1_MG-2023]
MNLQQTNWLFILPTDKLQGSEQIIMNQAKFVKANKGSANIIILTKKTCDSWSEFEENSKVTYFPFSNYFISIFFLIPYFIFSGTKNYTHTFTSQTIINGVLGFAKRIKFFKKTKIIVRESNSIFKLFSGFKLKIYRFFYHLGYIKSSLVICQTNYMKQGLLEGLNGFANNLNVHVLSNPINFEDIALKSKNNNTEVISGKYLVAAGRLMPVKGFDILIKSFKSILKEQPDLKLIILGEGKERATLENLIVELELQKKITLPGFVDNVYPYFNNATACILSSRLEGFPNVLLQMMSQNTNIVATLSAGDIDQIEGIFTCEPENETELSNCILKCLNEDNKNKRQIFDNFLSNRTIETFNLKMLDLIK